MMHGTYTLFLSQHLVMFSKVFLGLLCLCSNLKAKINVVLKLVNLIKVFLNRNSVITLKICFLCMCVGMEVADEMAHWGKWLATKPDDLGSIPRKDIVKERTDS